MLYNLGAIKKKKFNDLGMGTGKMLLQTFLSFPNLEKCVGVELSKGRYMLAERNLKRLLMSGWRGRRFQMVEFREGMYMKIVEVPIVRKTEFRKGEHVIAFNTCFRKNKYEKFDYRATVVAVSGSNVIVRYKGFKTFRINMKYVFEPGTERTCEI